MKTDISSTQSCFIIRKKKKAMINMSVHQLLCFFRSIHIIVDSHKIKMAILFAT